MRRTPAADRASPLFARRPAAPGLLAAAAPVPEPEPAGHGKRVDDLLVAHDAGGEDRPDDPDRARTRARRRPDADHDVRARLDPVRRRLDAGDATRPRRGPTWSTSSRRAALKTRPEDPAALRHRLGARPRQPLGATVFPHNIGLGATRDPDLVREVAHDHRRGDARHRPAVDLLAVHLRRPRRPLGPHLRVVQREPGARRAVWRPRSTATRDRRRPCSPPRSTTRATATPSTAPPPATTRSTRASRSPATRTSGTSRCGSTCPRCRTTTSEPSCRRSPASTGPTTAPARSRCTPTSELITDVLKGQIGFDGFVISDWEGIHQITDPAHRRPTLQVRTGVNAGIDMFMEPEQRYTDFITGADRRGRRRAGRR